MKLPKWGKEVKKAMIDEEMTLKQLAEKTGYCSTTVSMIINGRYGKKNFDEVAAAINRTLGINELPKMPEMPSEAWCRSVRKAMVDKGIMQVNQLANSIGFSRDRVSLVINGSYDKAVIEAINKFLGIPDESTS